MAVQIIIALISATGAALITQLGQYIRDRKAHKEQREDVKDDKNEAVMAELKVFKESVLSEVSALRGEVKQLSDSCEERDAIMRRARFTSFSDDLIHDRNFTKEHFDQMLMDITSYEEYCTSHPGFKNEVAAAAIENIRYRYRMRLLDNTFLK